MANGADIWDGPPPGGLSSPGGQAIQRTGCGDLNIITVRKTTDGVIANAATLNAFSNLDADGAIWIKDVPLIAIWVASLDEQSLTAVNILPYFAMTRGGTKFQQVVLDLTAGSGVQLIDNTIVYQFTGSVPIPVVFSLPNPGANWMFMYTSSAGTDTDSDMEFGITRGWGVPQPVPQV